MLKKLTSVWTKFRVSLINLLLFLRTRIFNTFYLNHFTSRKIVSSIVIAFLLFPLNHSFKSSNFLHFRHLVRHILVLFFWFGKLYCLLSKVLYFLFIFFFSSFSKFSFHFKTLYLSYKCNMIIHFRTFLSEMSIYIYCWDRI